MPIIQHAIYAPDGFERERLTTVESRDVKIAFTLRLPFRLRFEKVVRFECDVNGKCEIWFRNELPIKPGTPPVETLKLRGPHWDYWPLRTDMVGILHSPVVSQKLLGSIRKVDDKPFEMDHVNLDLVREAVNRCIIAYSTGTEELLALRPLSPLGIAEFGECIVAYIVLLGYGETQLTEETVLELLAIRPERRMISVREQFGYSPPDDLPTIDVSRIQALLSSHEENLHHELMLVAKNLMIQRQASIALLVAMAALETVHGAFLREALGAALPDEEGEKSRVINDFMREQGFYALVRISPYLFLEPGERPTRGDIELCMKGIEIRNAVMHGLVKKGRFKMRGYSFDDYNEGYKGAFALYRSFSKALEKRQTPASPRAPQVTVHAPGTD